MLKVEKFLFCLDLEIGGYVIGGLSTFFCSITLLLTLLGTVLIAAVGCDGLREMVKENGGDISEFDETCALGKAFIFFILIIIMFVVLGFLAIAVLCIKGTNNRDHIHVRPMMIVEAVFTVLQTLNLVYLTMFVVFTGSFHFKIVFQKLLDVFINGYCFVVLYSLFDKFRTERERGNVYTAQYQAPQPVAPEWLPPGKA